MAGATNRFIGSYHRTPAFASFDVSTTSESIRLYAASGISAALLNTHGLSSSHPTAEVWRPVGVYYIITTTITTNSAVLTLWRNGAAVATGGTATIPTGSSSAAREYFVPLTTYSLTADALADYWSLKVTTAAGAGVITVSMLYATRLIVDVNMTGV